MPLSEFMAHVGCTHQEARQIMRQACAAIRHAHKAGVCHRDLRLENVMLQQGAACNVKVRLGVGAGLGLGVGLGSCCNRARRATSR